MLAEANESLGGVEPNSPIFVFESIRHDAVGTGVVWVHSQQCLGRMDANVNAFVLQQFGQRGRHIFG